MSIIARFVHDPRAGASGRPNIFRRFVAWAIANLILFDQDENDVNGFSHVEAVLTDGRYIGAHTTGVEARPSDYDAGLIEAGGRERFYLLEADDVMSAKFYHYMLAVAEKHEGYDIRAIFGFITHFDLNTVHTTICSGLFILALRWCNWLPVWLEVLAHRISVRDAKLMLLCRRDVHEIKKTDPVFIAHISSGKSDTS